MAAEGTESGKPQALRRWGAALVTLASVASTQAGTVTETDILDDANTVSLASRFEQPVKRAPASITVITREMLDASGARTWVDVFRLVPGFESYQINAHRYGISAHGVGNEFPNKLEVMVDGRSLYEPVLSTVNWGTLGINLEDIDHIEVVRGASASTQGSNAFQGAVNIITRQPVQDSGSAVRGELGDRDTQNVSLRHNDRVGKLDYRLSLGYQRDPGFPSFFHQDENSGRIDDAFETYQLGVRGTYTPSVRDALDISAGYTHDRLGFGEPDHPAEYLPTHFESHYQDIKWTRILAGGDQLELHGYHNSLRGRGEEQLGLASELFGVSPTLIPLALGVPDQPVLTSLDIASERLDLELSHQLSFTDQWRGVWGLGSRYEYAQSDVLLGNNDKVWEESFRLFAHSEWQPMPGLFLNLGVMIEKNFVGTLVSPRVGLNYELTPQQTLRLAVAKASRSPSILEARENNNLKLGGLVIDPGRVVDPDLNAERLTSYEMGWLGDSADGRLSIDVRLFREQIENGINDLRVPWVPAVPALTPFVSDTVLVRSNLAEWDNTGAEVQVFYRPTAKTFLRIHYTNKDLDSRDVRRLLPKPDIRDFDHAQARHSGGLLVNHQLTPALDVGTFIYYQSQVLWRESGNSGFIEPITRIDAQTSYRFNVGRSQGKIQLVVQNLTDDYPEFHQANAFSTATYVRAELSLP
jgi:iron complex outermembrane receptor protein